MKLWKKISLLCGIVFIAVVTLCCTLLLAESKSNVLNLTYQQAIDKQTNLATSFAEMAGYYSDKGDFETTSYSLIQYCQYCFSRFADSSCVLMHEGKTLYSEAYIDPNDYLQPVNERKTDFPAL